MNKLITWSGVGLIIAGAISFIPIIGKWVGPLGLILIGLITIIYGLVK